MLKNCLIFPNELLFFETDVLLSSGAETKEVHFEPDQTLIIKQFLPVQRPLFMARMRHKRPLLLHFAAPFVVVLAVTITTAEAIMQRRPRAHPFILIYSSRNEGNDFEEGP